MADHDEIWVENNLGRVCGAAETSTLPLMAESLEAKIGRIFHYDDNGFASVAALAAVLNPQAQPEPAITPEPPSATSAPGASEAPPGAGALAGASIANIKVTALDDGTYRSTLLKVSPFHVVLLAMLLTANSVQVCERHDPHKNVGWSARAFVRGIGQLGATFRSGAIRLASGDVGRNNLRTGQREHWFDVRPTAELEAQRARDAGMVSAVLRLFGGKDRVQAIRGQVAELLKREPPVPVVRRKVKGECWWLMCYFALAALAGIAAYSANYWAAMYLAASLALGRAAKFVHAVRFTIYARAEVVLEAHARNLDILRAATPSPLGDLLAAELRAHADSLPSADCATPSAHCAWGTEPLVMHFDDKDHRGAPKGTIKRLTACPWERSIDTAAVLDTKRVSPTEVEIWVLILTVPLSAHLPAFFDYDYAVGEPVPVTVPEALLPFLPAEARGRAAAGTCARFAHRSINYFPVFVWVLGMCIDPDVRACVFESSSPDRVILASGLGIRPGMCAPNVLGMWAIVSCLADFGCEEADSQQPMPFAGNNTIASPDALPNMAKGEAVRTMQSALGCRALKHSVRRAIALLFMLRELKIEFKEKEADDKLSSPYGARARPLDGSARRPPPARARLLTSSACPSPARHPRRAQPRRSSAARSESTPSRRASCSPTRSSLS